MARLPRLNLPNIPLHVIQRGNNRHACFFSDTDYTVYLDKLKEYSRKYKVQVHSYILMTNHVHLLITPKKINATSQLMQALGRYYVRYINKTYTRTGTLWEGRYRASVIDTEKYFLTVSRYIELNPVRAKMVQHLAEYPWSSYHKNALGKKIDLITPNNLYLSLGKTNQERQQRYQSLFEQIISNFTLNEIRNSVSKGWVLGDILFKKQIEQQIERSIPPLPRGGDKKSKKYKANILTKGLRKKGS